MTLEEYLARRGVIDDLIASGLWNSPKVRRLILAIYGSEEECDEFIMNCSKEDIDTILITDGFDLDALQSKFRDAMDAIHAKMSANQLG